MIECNHKKEIGFSFCWTNPSAVYDLDFSKCKECGTFDDSKVENTSEILYSEAFKHHYQMCNAYGFEFKKVYIDGRFEKIVPIKML